MEKQPQICIPIQHFYVPSAGDLVPGKELTFWISLLYGNLGSHFMQFCFIQLYSNLTHRAINLWGYGEVVPDGVGLAYAVNARSCVFQITALRATGWTDKLAELLEEVLLEMRKLVEANQAISVPAKSKL